MQGRLRCLASHEKSEDRGATGLLWCIVQGTSIRFRDRMGAGRVGAA